MPHDAPDLGFPYRSSVSPRNAEACRSIAEGKMRVERCTVSRGPGGLRIVLVATVDESGETTSASFEIWSGDVLKAGPFATATPTKYLRRLKR